MSKDVVSDNDSLIVRLRSSLEDLEAIDAFPEAKKVEKCVVCGEMDKVIGLHIVPYEYSR